MPATSLNRIETINTGSQPGTWGETLNRNWKRVDEMVDGLYGFPLSGDKFIVYSNGSNDEAHFAGFTITGGTGGRVHLQPIASTYLVRNLIAPQFDANGNQTSYGDVLFTINGTSGAVIPAGVTTIIVNDGVSNVWQIGAGAEGNKAYVDRKIAETVDYAEQLAFETVTGNLPGQSAHVGEFLTTDGTTAGWKKVNITDVPGLAEALEDQLNQAIAAALIL